MQKRRGGSLGWRDSSYQPFAEQLVVKDLVLVLVGQFLAQSDGLLPHLSRHTHTHISKRERQRQRLLNIRYTQREFIQQNLRLCLKRETWGWRLLQRAQSSQYKHGWVETQSRSRPWQHRCLNLNKSSLYLLVNPMKKKRKYVNCHSPARRAEELFSQKFTSDGPEGLMSTDASFKKVVFFVKSKLCRPCPCRSSRWWCRRASLWAAAGFVNRGTQTAGCTSHPATVVAAAAAAAAVEQETQSKENWISSFFFPCW